MVMTQSHTYIYSFVDPSSAQVGLNVEFVMKRAKLQYAIRLNLSVTNYIILIRTQETTK